MRAHVLTTGLALALSACATSGSSGSGAASAVASSETPRAAAEWSMKATIIEACSCPMFCQCYFDTKPADHPGCCPPGSDPTAPPRYCRFNNAFRVDHGSFGDVKLDGAKFWLGGDLGGDFTKGQMMWCRLHFDPAVTKAQRDAITQVLGHVYPVKWDSFEVGEDAAIEWTAGKDRSVARLKDGKLAEVVLARNQGMTDEPIVIHNLRYWGVPRNEGFVLMQNDVEAYRGGDKPFEFKRTNGFMITFDISSKDVAAAKAY